MDRTVLVEVLFVGTVFGELLFVQVHYVRTVSVGIVFVSFIISSHIITESRTILHTCLQFLQLHVAGFQIYFFSHIRCSFGFLHLHQHLLLFPSIKLTFTFDWYIFSQCFWLLIPVIILKACKFKSFVSFGTHTLLDKYFNFQHIYLD